jgi:molybdopterin converting factor small subunit
MIIHVRAFANFRDILGKDLKLELKDKSTVKDLLDSLCVSHQRTNPGNSLSLSREAILAIYEEGPDAVVATPG